MQVLDAATVARIDLTQLHLVILNVNDRSSSGNLATALPDSEAGGALLRPRAQSWHPAQSS